MAWKSAFRQGLWWVPVAAAMVVLPFFWRGTSNGHDLTFHVNSWIEVARQWKLGTFYPHWAAFANFGSGEPRFVFYPPISWMLGALLGLVMPWSATPGALSFAVCIASGISMFLFAREWLDDATAVLAAIVYAVNPYLLVVIYERGAFAEMLAAVWLPGILLFALRERGGLLRNALLLAVHIALIWLTNLPSAVIASYLLAFVVLVRAAQLRRSEPLLRAAIAMALGLGLASFYLVPAVHEQRWVQIGQAVSSGASPHDNFLFAHTGDAEHDEVLLRTSIFALLEFSAVALFASFARPLRERSRGLFNILLGTSVLTLFLLLPWSNFVWTHAPKLMFVQFPWRWLMVLSVALAVFVGVTLGRTRASKLAMFVIIPALILVCYWKFQQKIYPEDRPVALAEAIANGEGYEGTDEYTPINADNSKAQPYQPRIAIQIISQNDEQRKVAPSTLAHSDSQRWDPEHKRFTVDSQVPTRDTLRLLDYPAWKVEVDGKPYPRGADENDGRMVLDLAPGRHEVTVDYSRGADQRWGAITSIVSLLLLLGLFAWTRIR